MSTVFSLRCCYIPLIRCATPVDRVIRWLNISLLSVMYLTNKEEVKSLFGLFYIFVTALLFPLTGPNKRLSECFRHACPKCGRTYKWRSSLKSHLQNECGKEPSCICPHCPYRCKVRSNLLKHVRNYHKTETTTCLNLTSK